MKYLLFKCLRLKVFIHSVDKNLCKKCVVVQMRRRVELNILFNTCKIICLFFKDEESKHNLNTYIYEKTDDDILYFNYAWSFQLIYTKISDKKTLKINCVRCLPFLKLLF